MIAGLTLAVMFLTAGCERSGPALSERPTGSAQPPTPSTTSSTNLSAPVVVTTNAPAGMVWIPAGDFWMGGPAAGPIDELRQRLQPGDPVCNGIRSGFMD